MPTKDAVLEWRGQNLVDSDGGKIGKIEEIYLDSDTDRPEWALVTTGMFGGKSSFVPIAEARDMDGRVTVPFSKSDVTEAPAMDTDGSLSQPDEAELYRHYGMQYTESGSDSGLPEGEERDDATAPRAGAPAGDDATAPRTGASASDDATAPRTGASAGDDVSGRETDDAMTRSEEELRVGTTQREAGRARLRKYVVTENMTKTVPVRREEVRVEREPITEANRDAATSGADISEEEHEVVLHEEEVVVDKQAVAKERVRLDKDTVTEERDVTEGVRKEQIEMIDADGEPAEGRDGVRGTDDGAKR